jgi:hypothetical protein
MLERANTKRRRAADDKSRAAARERRRRCRRLKAAGKIVLKFEIYEFDFVDALLLADDKYLPEMPPNSEPTREQINAAAAAVLAAFIRRWRG